MDTALTISILFASISWSLFTISYALRAKWWKTPFGINMMGVGVVVSLLLDRLALLYILPDVTADLKLTGLVLYALFGVLGLHRAYLMEKAQRQMGKHVSVI